MNRPCTKKRFDTRQEAEDALVVARIRAALRLGSHCSRRRECRVYYCHIPSCLGFHLTSQPVKDRRVAS
jgi:hypothetical protein